MTLPIVTLGRINIICADRDRILAFFNSLLKSRHHRPYVLNGISAFELALAYLSKKKRKSLEKIPLHYPLSFFLARFLSFLLNTKVTKHASGGLLIDLLKLFSEHKKTVSFISGQEANKHLLIKNLKRLVPKLRIQGFLSAQVARMRPSDTYTLLQKAKPCFIYLSSELKESDYDSYWQTADSQTRPDNGPVPAFSKSAARARTDWLLLFTGKDEEYIFAERFKPVSPVLQRASLEWLYHLLKSPLSIFRTIIYLYFLLKIVIIKLGDKYTLQEYSYN